jgi:transcriptional regulator with XRE-family HTH domain
MNDSSFENRIKKIISLVGSAEKLSHSAGMSPSLIGKYLSGKTDPTRKKLIALSEAAGVNVQWLATGEGLMRNGEWHQLKPEFLTLFIEMLEDYKNELGENFTHEKRIEKFNKLYELSSDNFPTSERAKKKIQSTIIDVFDLLPTLERMVEIEKDRKLAQKIVKSIFEKILPAEEADREAEELILTRLIKRGQK